MTAFAKTVAAISGALLLLLVGVWWGGHPESLPGPLRDAFVDDDRALRAELVDSIHDSFYKPVKRSEIDQGSLKGIVNGLGDQFSQYLTPAETREFRQPAAVLLHAQPHALQLARHGLPELARLRRGEVLRELVAKAVHDPLQRALVDLRSLHRFVEAVVDRVHELGAQRAVVVHEGVAERSGQGLRVPAPPHAHQQEQQGARDGGDCLCECGHRKGPLERPGSRVVATRAWPPVRPCLLYTSDAAD